MRRLIITYVVFGFIVLCAGTTMAQATKAIWLVDDFEDGDLVLWNGPTGGCTVTNTALTGANASSRSLRVDGECGVFGGAWTDLGGFQTTGVTFWVSPGSTFLKDSYVVLGDNDIETNFGIFYFNANSTSEFLVTTNSFSYSLGSYNNGQWYRVDLSLDWVGKTIDVNIDGVPRQRNIPFKTPSTTSLTRLHFFNWDNSAGWLDEISRSTPAASTDVFGNGFESADTTAWSTAVPAQPQRLVLFDGGGVSGAIGGRSGADVMCGNAAVSMPGIPANATTRAFLSFSADDEIRDMPGKHGVPTDRQVTGPNWNVIASDWADLLDGSIAMRLNSAGIQTETQFWYSGSLDDGSVSAYTCSGWTDGSTFLDGRYGSTYSTTSTWINNSEAKCGATIYHVLCLAWR